MRGLQEFSQQELLGEDKISKLEFCETCVLGKSSRVKLSLSTHKSNEILEYIHSNLWGPAKVESKGGSKYCMIIIDDFSQKS